MTIMGSVLCTCEYRLCGTGKRRSQTHRGFLKGVSQRLLRLARHARHDGRSRYVDEGDSQLLQVTKMKKTKPWISTTQPSLCRITSLSLSMEQSAPAVSHLLRR